MVLLRLREVFGNAVCAGLSTVPMALLESFNGTFSWRKSSKKTSSGSRELFSRASFDVPLLL